MQPIAEEEEDLCTTNDVRLTISDMRELDLEVCEMEAALDRMNRSLSRVNRQLGDYMGEKVKLELRLQHVKRLVDEALGRGVSPAMSSSQCVVS